MENDFTVLILEDEDAIRESLAAYLEDFGISVLKPADVNEAREMCELREPAVAIVDLRLPGTGGDAFIQEVHDRCPGTRFILYTGSPPEEVPSELLDLPWVSPNIFFKPVFDLKLIYDEVVRCAGETRG